MAKYKKYIVYTIDKSKFWDIRAFNKEDAASRAWYKYTDINRKIIIDKG